MQLTKIIENYKNQKIDKHVYVEMMYELHASIEGYVKILQKSDVECIMIRKDGIVLEMKEPSGLRIKHIHGDKYDIPFQLLNFGEYEKDENKIVMDLVKDGDVVFDIGANVGWYAMNIIGRYSNTTVYSFEPLLHNYKILLENFELNKMNPKFVYNFGFYNKNQHIDFYFDKENCMATSITDLHEKDTTCKITCQVKTMDSFVSNQKIERIDFIKCDVEGAEIFVLEGGIQSIENNLPIIFLEMLRKWTAKFRYTPNDIIVLLGGLGYDCYEIIKGSAKPISMVTEETISTNYIFLHKEKHVYEKKILENYKE